MGVFANLMVENATHVAVRGRWVTVAPTGWTTCDPAVPY